MLQKKLSNHININYHCLCHNKFYLQAAHGSLIPKWASNLYFSKPGRYEEALEHPYNLFHKAAEDKLPVMKGIRGGHVP